MIYKIESSLAFSWQLELITKLFISKQNVRDFYCARLGVSFSCSEFWLFRPRRSCYFIISEGVRGEECSSLVYINITPGVSEMCKISLKGMWSVIMQSSKVDSLAPSSLKVNKKWKSKAEYKIAVSVSAWIRSTQFVRSDQAPNVMSLACLGKARLGTGTSPLSGKVQIISSHPTP